jgi:Skp family chaperone for outer membrane proteins
MTLKLNEANLDAVDEAFRPLYEPKPEGGFRLKVEGVESPTGLQTALVAERKRAAEFEKRAKALESLGKTPEELAALITAQQSAEEERAKKSGDFDAILSQKQAAFQKEKDALLAELSASKESERQAVISNNLIAALSTLGATKEGIDLLPDRISSRIHYETTNGKRSIRITQADGVTPMAGSASDGSATFDDLAKEVSLSYPSLFRRKDNNGTGMANQNSSPQPNGSQKLSGTTAERIAALKSRHPELANQ